MKYYRLYQIPKGKTRKEKILVEQNKSKKELEKIKFVLNRQLFNEHKEKANFVITEINEVYVD